MAQLLPVMLKHVTHSQFAPPLNTAVASQKKNGLKRQRKKLLNK